MFDTSILTATLNDLYNYNADKYRLKSTEQVLLDNKIKKEKIGIIAHSDKNRYHLLTESEVGFFLSHLGVVDVSDSNPVVGSFVRMIGQ